MRLTGGAPWTSAGLELALDGTRPRTDWVERVAGVTARVRRALGVGRAGHTAHIRPKEKLVTHHWWKIIVALNILVAGVASAQGSPDTADTTADTTAVSADSTTTADSTAAPADASDGEVHLKDRQVHDSRPLSASILAYAPWWYGFGIGAIGAFEIPIVPDGFIPALNDQISLEPAFMFARVSYFSSLVGVDSDTALLYRPSLAGMWSFHISSKLRVFGAFSLGLTHVSRKYELAGTKVDTSDNYVYAELSGGVFFKLTDKLALRGEAGWQGLRGGLTILL